MESADGALGRPRNTWIMIPAGMVQTVLDRLVPLLERGYCLMIGGQTQAVQRLDRIGDAQRNWWSRRKGTARPDQRTMRRASNGGQPRCTSRAI